MNIAAWLEEIGFGHFAQRFEANAIDEALLAELTDEDLKTLGVGRLGDRKRLLRAIAARHAPEHALDPAAAPAERRGPPAEAERRQVSVLFADLVDFTRLANTLDEEALRELLSEFFDLADAAVCEFGGMVDKHIGDCIMAVFGAPIAHGDDAERAVRAALEIRRRTARLAAPDGSAR